MAPSALQQILLSPAELSYLHTSLSYTPPIRPDGRTSTQFRPLIAECDILPGTNGSARICFADGTEAIVGIKAEVEKSRPTFREDEDEGKKGRNEWVEISVEIPGFRDDDSMPVFLGAMLSEALLADGSFVERLWINRRFHWKIYLDILLLSQPLSYPLPLLSLTTHLALLSTRLPALKSEQDEDPLFNDDWDAAVYLFPRESDIARPPITLLVMAVGSNIIFDPSKEELAVAESVLAVSVAERPTDDESRSLKLLAVRTIDPPSRLTQPGVANEVNTATGGTAVGSVGERVLKREIKGEKGVWQPPRGGAKRVLVREMIRRVLEPGGVADEVLEGLEGVELG
ncbi:Ribosomal protein S5 2-like protein [Glarea lozoyensis ATCC 20868]|uniref:Ribosomal RNA-processing protein 42 n=1 Tax=Glarea lozoyensis (strain ATCC 20868 / MF5171) TaxID=1116229 RepID=S3DL98_GLAL2|nr:Ribosomal protein S5 2-like protein [Glarea lozoyensis ATCC 20868]EPE27323.1 Ribosomal protein S5 2-like protein [Glarea lozoyensis ATCC 20868]